MKINIEEVKNLAIKVLTKYGFSQEEALYCTENCLEGELTGKKTHGFVRIPMEKRIKKLMKKYAKDKIALEVLLNEQLEIDMYRKYSKYYGYVFYIIKK